MDRDYKELMYGAMFDELDRVQANKLYTDPELQKVALNIGGVAKNVKAGFGSLVKDPRAFGRSLKASYVKGSAQGGGAVGGVKRVLQTAPGQAAAAGGVGLLGAGALLAGRRRDPNDRV